ncbi:D-glycero-alpha-D-manno-heptose-1,7-bisphosphate 7-phosphatase [BD1-7 clade bacterium]|uniref:D,D-heptose 1,7-bisphosphate phosphatase n=1 Tax=BD1-7 clade bacterium TaxID=2029982 RepID=A0A5S9NLA9_9GAMM|nr:D-glycero-alpha-D-manno-heptose-1,7-bisphosphate 7-phosphatase [BD1-7 clade bacterium]CAA0093749.1 D-glycero-alpha-D-manno-heptose-1,7-bisphosphate 7-phosphatase [BD1-7 clade bacterium]
MKNRRPCLFLDRDGVINRDIAYAHKPEDITFVPGIFRLCRIFQRAGYRIVIVTNQSGIARGYYSEADFQHLTQWMHNEFRRRGITITATYHCPHHPNISGPCHCRKPAPGMLQRATKRYQLDVRHSVMIGDKTSDMQAAKAAGIKHRILISPEPLFRHSKMATMRVQYHRQIFARLNGIIDTRQLKG